MICINVMTQKMRNALRNRRYNETEGCKKTRKVWHADKRRSPAQVAGRFYLDRPHSKGRGRPSRRSCHIRRIEWRIKYNGTYH